MSRSPAVDRVNIAAVARSERFRAGLADLARALGQSEASVTAQALEVLSELRTARSPRVHRAVVRMGRALCRMGYDSIEFDAQQVESLRPLLQQHPAVVLSSHRSYLDGGVLNVGFHDQGLPAFVVFAGINMAFWPIGTIWRLAANVFIRRGSTDAVYKFVLRQYLGQLLEERRSMQWFIEGTRSRTGRMGPPRLGLLVYALEAWRDGRADDLLLLPTSVAYDQLREVEQYAQEALGGVKRPETLGWLLRFIRGQRGRFGRIHVRFGEPVIVRDVLDQRTPLQRESIERLAREVTRRIEFATPITGSALVAMALLGADGAALTAARVRTVLARHIDELAARSLPIVPTAALATDAEAAAVLDALVQQGLVDRCSDDHGELRYSVAAGGHVALAYYRNTILHCFVEPAVVQLALLAIARSSGTQRRTRFAAELAALQDLVAHDFFLDGELRDRNRDPEGLKYRAEVQAVFDEESWSEQRILDELPLPDADLSLRAYFEALAVTARALSSRPDTRSGNIAQLLEQAVAIAEQEIESGSMHCRETVARPLLGLAIGVLERRGLLEGSSLTSERIALFESWIKDILQRCDAIHRARSAAAVTESDPAGSRSSVDR